MRSDSHMLNYARLQGRGRIRLKTTADGVRIRFPSSFSRAIADTFGFYAYLAKIGFLVAFALFIVGMPMFLIMQIRLKVPQGWAMGVWTGLAGLTMLIFLISLLRRTEIQLTEDAIIVRLGLTGETWTAPRSGVTGINSEDGRPRIWLDGGHLLASGRESKALYWHEPMPADELEWLVETLRTRLELQ